MSNGRDVFLSYHWRDKDELESVARALQDRGLSVFLDRWYLVPGRPWHQALEAVTSTYRSVAVVISRLGHRGLWIVKLRHPRVS